MRSPRKEGWISVSDIRTVFEKPGCLVRDPQTMIRVPAEGLPVTWNSFWERRLQDGDIDVPEEIPQNEVDANASGRKTVRR